MAGLLLRDVDVLLRGATWVREELLGGDEAYKSCRVCGKQISTASRLWRRRCRQCGHRTCPDHMVSTGACRKCEEEGPPGSVKAMASRLQEKLEHLERLRSKGLLTDEACERGRLALIDQFTKES